MLQARSQDVWRAMGMGNMCTFVCVFVSVPLVQAPDIFYSAACNLIHTNGFFFLAYNY